LTGISVIMAVPTRIFLTGFMGSGKSTIGPLVANVLGYHFIDLDDAIEARAGRSIPDIFEEQGEAAFRALEAEALVDTLRRDRIVVAVGGGALTFEVNLQRALHHGTVVYLRITVEQVLQRLVRSAHERPLLRDGRGRRLPVAALRRKITDMMAGREPFYRRAHITIDVGDGRVGDTVEKVVRALHDPLVGRGEI
jgi:shikimate kinase